MTTTCVLRGIDDILGIVPYLLGFHPRESLVAIVCRGACVQVTARADLSVAPDSFGQSLAGYVARNGDMCVILVAYAASRDDAMRSITETAQLFEHVAESVIVCGNHYFRVDDLERGDTSGHSFDAAATQSAASAVYAGMQAAPDREGLAIAIRHPLGGAAVAAKKRVMRAELRLAAWSARKAADAADDLLNSDPALLNADDLAMLAVMSVRPMLRDRALIAMAPYETDHVCELWQRVVTSVPKANQAAPLAVLGIASWLRGDGAMMLICLDKAEGIDAGCSLLSLLRDISAVMAPPGIWRKILDEIADGGGLDTLWGLDATR